MNKDKKILKAIIEKITGESSKQKNIDILNESSKSSEMGKKIYLDYSKRIIIFTLSFIIIFTLCTISLFKAFKVKEEKVIEYNENSSLDYRVYLKRNDFYENDYLGKNLSYIASLIDHIDIYFNYNFDISEKIETDFTYDVVGKLVIADSTGSNVFFEKDYTLIKEKQAKLINNNSYNLSEDVVINYDEYNDLANKFKVSYGVDTSSSLKVYLNIKKKSTSDLDKINIDEVNNMSITIPLSEKAINIKLDYNEINSNKSIIEEASISIDNIVLIIVSIILFIISIAILLRLLELLFASRIKMTKYDKYVNKLLREYDRLIVESSFCPEFEQYVMFVVKEFKELLDVRDNIKLPIMYYNVSPHNKCYFYIQHENNIYLYILKAVDINEK